MADMKQYTVIIPIAGHVTVSVEAENEDDAKEKAFEMDLADSGVADLEWETLTKFNQGNVCFCPRPWEIEVIEE